MTEPVKRLPNWLRLDITVLVAGAVIMIATALWLEPNGDRVAQRIAHSAQSTCQQLWQYVTERKKPAGPKLTAQH
jgi:hypothetical protein